MFFHPLSSGILILLNSCLFFFKFENSISSSTLDGITLSPSFCRLEQDGLENVSVF